MREGRLRPTLRELAQRVSRLLGGELSPEEVERTIRELREAEAKVKWYLDWGSAQGGEKA
jgi:DNA-binding Lrp family transcriptional regulator